MTDGFDERVEPATGLSLADALILGQAQSERRAELFIREAGYCCEAGATGYSPHPDVASLSCPWHGSNEILRQA